MKALLSAVEMVWAGNEFKQNVSFDTECGSCPKTTSLLFSLIGYGAPHDFRSYSPTQPHISSSPELLPATCLQISRGTADITYSVTASKVWAGPTSKSLKYAPHPYKRFQPPTSVPPTIASSSSVSISCSRSVGCITLVPISSLDSRYQASGLHPNRPIRFRLRRRR